MMTFLVVPALVVDGYGPFEAVSASTKLLKKTWGDQLVSNFSFELIFLLIASPGIIALVWALVVHASVVIMGLAIAYLVLVACVSSALHTIFQASLYIFTRDGSAPRGIPASVLQGAVVRA
jgi:hypothetical protein